MRKERKCDSLLIIFTAFITYLFTIIAIAYTSTDQMALEMLAAMDVVALGVFYIWFR